MKAATLVAAFEAEPDGDGYLAHCPAHADSRPSLRLSFNAETGKALLKCRAGCETPDVVEAAGLSMRDLADVSYITQTTRATKAPGKTGAVGLDAKARAGADAFARAKALAEVEPGSPLAALLRDRFGVDVEHLEVTEADALGIGTDPADGRLSVTLRDDRGAVACGQWRTVDPDDARPRWMPAVEAGLPWGACGFAGRRHPDASVVIVEGLSDALAVAVLDVYDVVGIRGASMGARVAELADGLAGRDVVLAIDADNAGRKCRDAVLDALATVAGSLRVIDLPEGTDVGDLRAVDPGTFGARLADLVDGARDAAPARPPFDLLPWLAAGTDVEFGRVLQAYAVHCGYRVAWNDSHGWLIFDGSRWHERAEARVRCIAHALGDVARHARDAAEARLAEAKTALALADGDDEAEDAAALQKARLTREVKRLAALHRAMSTSTRIDAALRELRAFGDVHSKPEDFDANLDVLGVLNGVVDLRTGALRPMRPEDRITRVVPVEYDADAPAPQWEKFLDEVLVGDDGRTADRELVGYFRAMIGYGATGHTSEQMLALMVGNGSNGKSVVLDVLGEVFHGIAQTTPFSTFEAKGAGAIPNDIAALKSARLVMSSESNAGSKFAEATIKSVTGGDVVTARFMRAEFFSYKPQYLILLASNHLPTIQGQDDGIWRRMKLIRFRRKFTDAEQDRGLAARIVEHEAAGVLAWAVRGAREWYEAGRRLPKCESVEQASKAYRRDSDVLGDFLAENIVETVDARSVVFLGDLATRYQEWCLANGAQATYGKKTLGKMLDERLGERRTNAAPPPHWRGFRILPGEEVAENRLRARFAVLHDCEPDEVELSPLEISDEAARLGFAPIAQGVKYHATRKFHVLLNKDGDTPAPDGAKPVPRRLDGADLDALG